MSNFWKQYKHVTKKVHSILKQFPEARDNDLFLIQEIWKRDLNSRNVGTTEILQLMMDKELSSPESIMRARRKLQEEDKSIRGKTYAKRHKHAGFVRDNINKDSSDADEPF